MSKNNGSLPAQRGKGWRYLLAGLMLGAFQISILAQTSLNIADYGAKGDAVQFYVNTVKNSVVVTTTNQLSSADIGKTVEVFRVGKVTSGVNGYGINTNDYQDLIATITNVVNATNIYLNVTPQDGATSYLPQVTATGVYAVYGTDNTPAFSNVLVAAAAYTNVTVNIPNGTYLCMPVYRYWPNGLFGYAYASIVIRRGGIHFVGESQAGTVLLSRGAWQIKNTSDGTPNNGGAFRGFLFEVDAPITNDYPMSIETMTLDGGVQAGNLDVHGIECNKVDGLGWDQQHSAYLTCDDASQGGTLTHQILTNLTVIHWRGEMIKSIDLNTNGNIAIKNCLFGDGNATALNIYPSWDVRNNTFSNLLQIGEYYQQHYTNTAYFCDNYITNMTGNGLALNGGTGRNPPFVISNNVFTGLPGDAILTTPGDNITITSNQFFNVNYPIVLGAAGYQGTFCNSNITINYNTFSNAPNQGTAFQILGESATDPNRVESVQIYGNTIKGLRNLLTYGWMTNVQIFSNTVASQPNEGIDGNNVVHITRYASDALFALIQTNNFYWTPIYDQTGKTNYINYADGSRFQVVYSVNPNTVYALVETNASLIPEGAQILINNSCTANSGLGQGDFFPVYLNHSLTGNPVIMTQGQVQAFYWNKIRGGYAWMTNRMIPPLNLRTNL